MSEREYAELVGRMRAAQREFFRGSRTEAHLLRCKSLEGEVDRETARRLAPPPPPTLFDGTPEPGDAS
jgi:hypothetical protein